MKRAWSMALGVLCCTARLAAQGDLCTGATLLSCGSVVTGNTGAPYTADVAPVCTTTDGTGGGVWYRIVGTGGTITASLCGSAFDTKIRVYSGTCAAPVCTAGNDDFCGLQSQVSWLSGGGTTYYILVHGFGAATGAYTLTISCAAPPVPLCYSMTATPYLADPYAGTPVSLTDDVHSAAVPIGFQFCYNGNTYTQCVISSNNYITFDLAKAGTYSPWVTVAVPNTTPTEPQNAILNPWQDINPGVGGNIYYQTLGAAPNRRFVVSYLNVPMFSCTAMLYTSQTVLYEGTNCIGSYIQTKPICATWNSGNAVHALQNSGGTSATTVAGRNNTQWTATSMGMFFVPTCAPCSTATTVNCLATVLPIDLLHFRGHNEGARNVLEWATASEQDNDHFTVERSSDGAEFRPIGTVPAAGNSNSLTEYLLPDETPDAGLNYYRLVQTGVDGGTSISGTIAVLSLPGDGVQVVPNPAAGTARYRLPMGTWLPAELVVRDLAGRPVRRIPVNDLNGTLDLIGLAPGSYMVVLDDARLTQATRVVIER